ncbi:MAG: mechanosensitive ion channel family protein [Bacteroides sp.]|nr:mechanosensitive ion channel family protein [Bacteroides sp.]
MEIYIPQLIATVIAMVFLYVSRYIIHKVIAKSGRLLQKSEIRTRQIRQLFSVLLNVVFVILVALIWGVKPGNLWVGLSSLFAIIGVAFFAQWSLLSNVTACVIMYFSAPFRIGERIRIIDKDNPIEATIENIHAFYTHIRTEEGELIVIPNNLFLQKIVSLKNNTGQIL